MPTGVASPLNIVEPVAVVVPICEVVETPVISLFDEPIVEVVPI